MLLNNYQADIIAIIQKYVNQGWILSFIFAVDARSDYVGFIQGSLEFVEGLRLFFKEYVDLQESIEKLSYSFHYQDRSNNLIFRYDNTNHKPDLGYIDHKHIKNKIIPSEVPNIEKVILEIIEENYAQKL
jgi:hypothetical protein